MIKKISKKSERGQAIIIIAAAFVGMIAMVGLLTDGGMTLIEYARLKRGIDAASIASAAQFRKDFVVADLETAAREFLSLNQSEVDTIDIDICQIDIPGLPDETAATDPLCELPVRKLVKVTATRHVTFGFLRVIGINGTNLTASSVGEAASIDMVLVIDTSSSMAFETTGNVKDPDYSINCPAGPSPASCVDPDKSDRPSVAYPYGDNPEYCNLDDGVHPRCEPLGTIKDVAAAFVDRLFFPYDRVSIVTLTQQVADGTRRPTEVLPLTQTHSTVADAIQGLQVFQPPHCSDPLDPAGAVCLNFADYGDGNGPVFIGFESGLYRSTYETSVAADVDPNNPPDPTGDPSLLTSSNIGGGLFLAGAEFSQPPVRQDSFWVVIALIGGPANATNRLGESPPGYTFPANGFCPSSTWTVTENPTPPKFSNFCRDADPLSLVPDPLHPGGAPVTATRHSLGVAPLYLAPADYDADDFARDGADYVANPLTGQGATIFSICVGNYCQNYPSTDRASGENLGIYMAEQAGDTPSRVANHGVYYLAEDANSLGPIFTKIAEKIFTRISQ